MLRLLLLTVVLSGMAQVYGGQVDPNGMMSTYGDTAFTGLNGVMEMHYTEEHMAALSKFNGVVTEVEPQPKQLAKGMNGVMDVFYPDAEDRIITFKNDLFPLVAASFHFTVNSAQLSMQDIADLTRMLELFRSGELDGIELMGYADVTGPAAYNQQLSARRAQAVKDWLVSRGVPAAKIRVRGMGVDHDADDLAKARRVDLVLSFK